jgi:hypothetical protein
VLDRAVLESTDGPVEHVKVQCLARHIFLMPMPMPMPPVPMPPAAAAAAGSEDSLTGPGSTHG